MPLWKSEVPTEKKHMGFNIARTPTSGSFEGIITCEEMVVCDTHYWGGRTTPCERKQLDDEGKPKAGTCPACNASIPYRTHVYVACVEKRTRDHVVFECTAFAAKAFQEYFEKMKSLRGCIFNARRHKNSPNSKVIIETNTVNLTRVDIPSPPDIIRILCTVWHIPMQKSTEHKKDSSSAEILSREDLVAQMRQCSENMEAPLTIGDILRPGSPDREGNGKPVFPL
jgi:hypothetical protein